MPRVSCHRFLGAKAIELPSCAGEKGEAAKWDLIKVLGNETQWTIWIEEFFLCEGVLNVVVFEAFLFGDYGDIGSLADRPDLLMLPTLEWAIYSAIVGYLLLISVYVWRKEKGVSPHLS